MKLTSAGDGPDLALIHGWGIGRSAWNDLLPLLTANFRVHCVALPGYSRTTGGTPDSTAQPLAPSDFKTTAAALAEALPAGCTLCGWSLGAQLTLQAALIAPQRFARLILCGATPSFRQRPDWPHGQPPALLDGFTAAVASNAGATLQRFIALANQGDSQARANARTLARAVAADGLAESATLARGLDWLSSVDLRASVAAGAPATPSLLIHGENDPLMPLAAARWLAQTLPRARLDVFAGAAHAPFLNDPERFARLIFDFCHAPDLN
jgi:pimeloyl-ACP methyl ester esterase